MRPSPKISKRSRNTECTRSNGQTPLTITRIVGMVPASRMPCSKGKIMGIINFQGKTIPVLDLRLHISGNGHILSEMICIMAGQISGDGEPLIFAALVDSEAEAFDILYGYTN